MSFCSFITIAFVPVSALWLLRHYFNVFVCVLDSYKIFKNFISVVDILTKTCTFSFVCFYCFFYIFITLMQVVNLKLLHYFSSFLYFMFCPFVMIILSSIRTHILSSCWKLGSHQWTYVLYFHSSSCILVFLN